MCGICGIYNLDGRSVDRAVLQKMNDSLIHRGPDDQGIHCSGHVGLGHRRLSIIDLNTGKQPIYNEDRTKVIVYNGEIYNYKNLRENLVSLGHVFTTETDTEVVLHSYEQWGWECVNKLRGMFAFAIWDNSEKHLFIARDRLGIKPLYYYVNKNVFFFGSELKAILASNNVEKEIDLEALADYFSLGYVPSPKSIFKNIYKLPAGHVMIVRPTGNWIYQYWDLCFNPEPEQNIEKIGEQLLSSLTEAVDIRLISDVPLGAFLSGGVDSSAVVAIMASLNENPVITNSIGFRERAFSELDDARYTADLFGCEHHEYTVSPNAMDIVERLAWYYDEPFADSSSIPTYYVSKMSRENVTVALSGDGGDENFLGYSRYPMDLVENRFRKIIPEFIKRGVVKPLSQVYPKADWAPRIFRGKTFLTNVAHEPATAHFNTVSLLSPELKRKLLHMDVQKSLAGYSSVDVFQKYYKDFSNNSCDDFLSAIQYVDIKTYLVDDILTKVDRASMANSLEVRVPILDHIFVEHAAKIPSKLKLNKGQSKIVFKKALEKTLPKNILNRKKMGFSIPLGQWLRNEIRCLGEDVLFNKKSKTHGFFNDKYVRSMWQQHLSGQRNYSSALWSLIVFHLWGERHL